METSQSLPLQQALRLAEAGVAVFPCQLSKAPACPGGFKASTAKPREVLALWKKYPGPLIGVPTGLQSGFDILDLDLPKHPEARAWWTICRAEIPPTRIQQTRSGGLHIFFSHHPTLRCSTSKIARGVDVRADGGYVIWWEAAGCPRLSPSPLSAWPSFLTELLTARRPTRRPKYDSARLLPDRRFVMSIVRTVAAAPQGSRNSILFWGACRLRERLDPNLLDLDSALELLVEAATRAGLSRKEALDTARNGLERLGEDQ